MVLFVWILLFYGLWVPTHFSYEMVLRMFHCLIYVCIDPNCGINFLLTYSFMKITKCTY